MMGEFAAGQLSLDQVTVVARFAPAHVEASVAELAVNASVPQLRRALSRYSFDPPTPETTGVQISTADSVDTADTTDVSDPPSWNGLALETDRASASAELSISHDDSGRFTLRFSAPADLGALVEAALKEAKDTLFRAGRPEVTMGDALGRDRRPLTGVCDLDQPP